MTQAKGIWEQVPLSAEGMIACEKPEILTKSKRGRMRMMENRQAKHRVISCVSY